MLQSVQVPRLPDVELIYWKTMDPADGKSIAFYEENGTPVYMAEIHMLLTVINKSFPSKEDLLMEFPIGLNCSNLNGNVLLKADTGADMNT